MENTNNSKNPIGVKISGYTFFVPYQLNELVANEKTKIEMKVGSMNLPKELLLREEMKKPVQDIEEGTFVDIQFVPPVPDQEKIISSQKEEQDDQEETVVSKQEQTKEAAEITQKQQRDAAEQERILIQQTQESSDDKLPGEDDSII